MSKGRAKKQNALQGCALPGGRLNDWCAVDSAGEGPGTIITPERLSDVDLTASAILEK